MRRKVYLVVALAALLITGFQVWNWRERELRASKFVGYVHQLEARPKTSAKTNSALLTGTNDRTQLFQVREAYSRLKIVDSDPGDQIETLTVLGEGLFADNEIVRDTTDDFIRHVLSEFVRAENPARWHSNPEIDAFFHLYKSNSSRSLNRFLNVYPDSPEAQYLKSI